MAAAKIILILGGGIGGIIAAGRLRKQLPREHSSDFTCPIW